MFQLDDKFLEDVGLGGLPDDQKKLFLDHFREQLELRVGTQLSEGLSEAQLSEFESFMDRDMQRVTAWLDANVPDFDSDPVYVQLKANVPQNVPQNAVLSEYASLKWLGINRPNYREVVTKTIEALKKEISENRDVILGAASE
ncbi:MAG: hypothetical protein HXK98_03010 [Candidatus Nanogingivalaceae bacterium]|jgi:hypothetical protein cdivTM_08533|nr:hypothetical protein [Candidatus Nanogingivalaceae bacterium]